MKFLTGFKKLAFFCLLAIIMVGFCSTKPTSAATTGSKITMYCNGGTYQSKSTYTTTVSTTAQYDAALYYTKPSRTGYTFDGWWSAASGGTRASGSKMYTTVYAHWKANKYTITFNTNGGTKIASKTLDYGTVFTLPSPTKSGFGFDGWASSLAYVKPEYGKNTSYKVTGNKTLYAVWHQHQWTGADYAHNAKCSICGVENPNSKVTSCSYIYDPCFSSETTVMVDSLNSYVGKSGATTSINLAQKGDFVSAWNDMPYAQKIVVVNTHGTPDSFAYEAYAYSSTWLKSSEISKLKSKSIECIVLLGCNCGHFDYRTTNIARKFSDKFNCPVIAADGTVYYKDKKPDGKNNPKANDTWKGYVKDASYKGTNLGWVVYKQGKVYSMGRHNYTLKELLTRYLKNNDATLQSGTSRQ